MLQAEVIPTEYTRGSIAGANYGSRARVVLRSPDAFIFVALGVHMTPRGSNSYHDTKAVCEKANVENFSRPEVRARIVEMFGEGADEAVLMTTRKKGYGTVLFNGGGKRLPLPDEEMRVLRQKNYDAVSPNTTLSPEGAQTCLQCGKPLRLHTIKHWFASPNSDEKPPTTVEELQRLTNYPIVRVSGFGSNKPEEWWPYIEYFETWDGESYEDDTFCSDRCAAVYGRRAAAELTPLPEGGEAPTRARNEHESIRHYDVKAEEDRQRKHLEEHWALMQKR
jgi:hypothetical protein